MKHIKESKLEIYKLSDLDSWTKPEGDYYKLDNKDLEKNTSNILNYLSDHNICIEGIEKGKYLHEGLRFPSETNKYEYRFSISKTLSLEELNDNWGIKSEEDLNDLHEEDLQEYLEGKKLIGQANPHSESVEFSVISDKRVKLDGPYTQSFLLIKALSYLADLILSYKQVIFGQFDYTDSTQDMDSFKALLNKRGEKITNKNLEYVKNIEYRLYKDNKFFNIACEFLFNDNKDEMKEFIKGLYSLFNKI